MRRAARRATKKELRKWLAWWKGSMKKRPGFHGIQQCYIKKGEEQGKERFRTITIFVAGMREGLLRALTGGRPQRGIPVPSLGAVPGPSSRRAWKLNQILLLLVSALQWYLFAQPNVNACSKIWLIFGSLLASVSQKVNANTSVEFCNLQAWTNLILTVCPLIPNN